jgi:hypothetical protein
MHLRSSLGRLRLGTAASSHVSGRLYFAATDIILPTQSREPRLLDRGGVVSRTNGNRGWRTSNERSLAQCQLMMELT